MRILSVILITFLGIGWAFLSVTLGFAAALGGKGISLTNPLLYTLFLPVGLSSLTQLILEKVGLSYEVFPPLYWAILPTYFGIQTLFLIKMLIQKILSVSRANEVAKRIFLGIFFLLVILFFALNFKSLLDNLIFGFTRK